PRFHGLDVGVDVRHFGADGGEQPLPILDLHRQLDRVARTGVALVPLHFDPPLGVVEQVDDVRTGCRVDGHTFAPRDVADDFFAADRIAAARTEHHQVVEAVNLDLLFAGAEHAPDDRGDGPFGRLLAQLVGRHEPDQKLLRLDLAVADGGEQVVRFGHREV